MFRRSWNMNDRLQLLLSVQFHFRIKSSLLANFCVALSFALLLISIHLKLGKVGQRWLSTLRVYWLITLWVCGSFIEFCWVYSFGSALRVWWSELTWNWVRCLFTSFFQQTTTKKKTCNGMRHWNAFTNKHIHQLLI